MVEKEALVGCSYSCMPEGEVGEQNVVLDARQVVQAAVDYVLLADLGLQGIGGKMVPLYENVSKEPKGGLEGHWEVKRDRWATKVLLEIFYELLVGDLEGRPPPSFLMRRTLTHVRDA